MESLGRRQTIKRQTMGIWAQRPSLLAVSLRHATICLRKHETMTDQPKPERDISDNENADDLPSPFEMSLAFADESNLQEVFDAMSAKQETEQTET